VGYNVMSVSSMKGFLCLHAMPKQMASINRKVELPWNDKPGKLKKQVDNSIIVPIHVNK